MVNRKLYIFLGLVLLVIPAGEEHMPSLVKGYQAYVNADYDTALHEYELALQQSNDPGRYALDLGAIAAQAGRYSEAVQWFSRSLEDATVERQLIALYGQATSLTHLAGTQQGKRAVMLLERAIAGYQQTLLRLADVLKQNASRSHRIVEKQDIEHNLNIAIALLKQKQQEPEPPEQPEQPDNTTPPSLTSDGTGTGNARVGSMQGPRGSESASSSTEQSIPGRGNLPALPDDEEAPPISAEEAERRLQQLLKRLRQPLSTAPLKPGNRDW